jgi:hypothetical protein
MLQSDYNSNPYQCILYYCNSPAGQNDPTVYNTDLSNVCSLYYDGSNNIQISGWLLTGYGAPSTTTILTYNISTVLTFYNNFYTIPAAIAENEPYMISTTDLSNIRADSSMIGFVVYDTTVQATKYLSSALSWETTASKYLSSSGGTLNGNLNMNSNNITNINTLYQSSPSLISIYTSANSAISFTASTPRIVSLGSFSQTINPNSDFSFSSSTGQITYTGSITRYFRIHINYSTTALAVAATLTNYISKNSSTSISGLSNVVTYLLLGSVTTNSYSLSDIMQLANGNTIQLGAECSSTQNVTYSNISYSIDAL